MPDGSGSVTGQHKRAKAAFDRALARWRAVPELNQGRLVPLDSAQATELLDLAHATAVEALLWARAFDDAARGSDGIPALSGYPDKDKLPAEIKAARWAANKGVHLLVELAAVDHVGTIGAWGTAPWGAGLVAPMLRWVSDQSRLPQVKASPKGKIDQGDQDIRDAFVAHWRGQPVAIGLTEVEAWLNHWCA
ncbi:hypothetical protein G7043_31320 [Lentzea sp. NEAU-D13]|uniref:Uncharacterized protein n=1 Tax=Lentzea alba TaxID=2714351 RepID=A0A7C9RWJ0_9PSEU|nr:hypothetical protein [Lentzea alba]NGY63423.1 hypothetical protein [Lentzea alba]